MTPERRPGRKGGPADASGRLLGESLAIRGLRKAIGKFAPLDAPVLVTGETGTGKELVARSLHELSARSKGPFVAVNCAAWPDELFHAQFFGYEKGAFTGAFRRHDGHIDAAKGGTLLLDEIGDLNLETQVVLLRFLDEGWFERLGNTESVHADVRIIALTNADLEAACRHGRFREDLYYRLNAFRLRMPPLRDRGSDMELLATAFLDEFTEDLRLARHRFSGGALEAIRVHDWPGNVRELRNRIRQALVMSEDQDLHAADLGLAEVGAAGTNRESRKLCQAREKAEFDSIHQTLLATGGNVTEAAARLGISRAQLYRLVRRYDLDPKSADRRRTARSRGRRTTEPD